MNCPWKDWTALLPYEHGAYGMLLFPIASALALPGAGAASACMGAGLIAAFLAHPAALAACGVKRGRSGSRRAYLLAVALALSACALLAAGAAAAPWDATVALVASAVSALALAHVVAHHQERTPRGELFSALVLASSAAPVALAAGEASAATLVILVVWMLVYAAAARAVRAVYTLDAVRRPSLRAVGWSMVSFSSLTLSLLVVSLR